MTGTAYRFLPWARRGLAAALPAVADGAALPSRARVEVGVVVAGAGNVSTATTLYGPGDVVGLDPTVIVRTLPRPDSTNVEPNYLAAVDFDQPELPWLFTPGGAPASNRLRPWLVLVVVHDRPGVAVTVSSGTVLPRLTIDSGAAAELPDLADSWAWAHAQLLDTDAGTTPAAVGQALADHPDRNVSRLLCPRRLEPDQRWIACLVPAFDAGVTRGLGGVPDPGTALQPAWTSPDRVELPVYYHWRFQTGPQGDFESLARRLKPYEASARLGRVKMHIGAASPFVGLPLEDPARFLDMDGALQALPVPTDGAEAAEEQLSDVPEQVRADLEKVSALLADAADGKLDGVAPDEAPALGPPLYAGQHHRRTTVTEDDDTWFRELNTDPRARVAAGLGAEVMRKYQEDVVAACWEQVGNVLAVEAALSRARLCLEVGLRFRERHLASLPAARLLQLAAPVAARTVVDGETLPALAAPTSYPDRTTDAAMRRRTAPTSRIIAGVARRSATPAGREAVVTAGLRLVATLAGGRADVDASRFPVPVVDGLPAAMPQPDERGTVSLERFGVSVRVDRAGATALGRASRALQTAPAVSGADLLRPRTDVRASGLFGSAQLEAAREASRLQLDGVLARLHPGEEPTVGSLVGASTSAALDVVAAGARNDDQAGVLLQTGKVLTAHPLGIRAGGDLVVLNPPGVPNVTVARLGTLPGVSPAGVGDVVGRLPAGSIPALRLRRGGGVLAPPPDGGSVPAREGTTVTAPPLLRDAAVIGRFEQAMGEVAVHTAVGDEPPTLRLVPFPLAAAAAGLLTRTDPRVTHPRRLDTMVSIAGLEVTGVLADPARAPAWLVAPLLDRVMAYPVLELPAYTYLAGYDRTRFCPGVDEVPPESITLLETNPRFIAAFMAGLNQETCQELLWRGYPSDGRGTPWRRFWARVDGAPDIDELHRWGPHPGPAGVADDLRAQTTDPRGNLVLMLRGDLLRRYPNTMVVAVRAVLQSGREQPSGLPDDLRTPVFAGRFDPDVSFFGFPLTRDDLTQGDGWFFGLMEPVTEPRFGFDETVGRETPAPTTWNDVAWPDLGVPAGGRLTVAELSSLGLAPGPGRADAVAAALYQRPFELLVHARHLVRES